MAEGSILLPGNYDGVHVGHRVLIDAALRLAETEGLRSTVLFFDPHPLRIVDPARAPEALTSASRRAELLRAAGVAEVVAQPFDHAFSQWSPKEFVDRLLIDRFAARIVVTGEDFRFGRGREGDVEGLRRLGERYGFHVLTLEAIQRDHTTVSSSRIRRLIKEGDVESAAELLARHHEAEGRVVRGAARGRQIGFPTANLDFDALLLPPHGVYAVWVRSLDRPRSSPWRGVANLGVRPTFDAGLSLEVHLLDQHEDLYGERLRVAFVSRLREEQRFDGVEALKAQIAADCRHAEGVLASASEDYLRWF